MKIAALLRVHRRARTLDIVLSEIARYGKLPGIQTIVQVAADRPSKEVEMILARHKSLIHSRINVEPIVSKDSGERFQEVLNEQLEVIQDWKPDWVLRQDDDEWLEPCHATEELPLAIHDPEIDLWYAFTVYMWDRPNQYNFRRKHFSPYMFRYIPGDRFPTNRLIHATELLHDRAVIEGRQGLLRSPLLDYGTFTEEERQENFERYLKAGRLDDFTRSLVEPPDLRIFPEDAIDDYMIYDREWKDLWTEAGT